MRPMLLPVVKIKNGNLAALWGLYRIPFLMALLTFLLDYFYHITLQFINSILTVLLIWYFQFFPQEFLWWCFNAYNETFLTFYLNSREGKECLVFLFNVFIKMAHPFFKSWYSSYPLLGTFSSKYVSRGKFLWRRMYVGWVFFSCNLILLQCLWY